MSNKKQALGRGLGALLSDANTDITSKYANENISPTVGNVANIVIDQIDTNPFQPRTEFDKKALVELAESIKELGIIQPITVRKLGNDRFQLISGERRFRASQLAGLKEIPAYIRVANDQAMLEMALVENIQRRDLNPIEIAVSYQRLIDECGLTQEELGGRVGKDRSSTSNYLRLLSLPPEIQTGIIEKQISFGHARTLITIEDEQVQLYIFDMIIKDSLSVRKVEELVRETKEAQKEKPKKVKNNNTLSFNQQKLREDLKMRLKTSVDLKLNKQGGGNVLINFKSEADLERIMNLLDV